MKYSVNYFLSCMLILVSLFSQAQQAKTSAEPSRTIDSLKSLLKTSKVDTVIVNSLITLSVQNTNLGNLEQAFNYAKQAQQLAEKINFKKGVASSFSKIGIIYFYQADYDKAYENFLKSLIIQKEIGDKEGIANAYSNIGLIYKYQGNYEKAIDNHLKSLMIREEIADKEGTAGSYGNIGNIYFLQGNVEKALSNYSKSLKVQEQIGDKKGAANSYNNIGSIYLSHENYEKALSNFMKSLKMLEDIGDKKGISASHNNIGSIYLRQDNYEKALNSFLKSLKIQEEIRDNYGIANSFNNIGDTYSKMAEISQKQSSFLQSKQEYEKALEYLDKGLNLAKEILAKELIKNIYNSLFTTYERMGSSPSIGILSDNPAVRIIITDTEKDYIWRKAFEYHKLYSAIKDTLLNEESNKEIAEMSSRYESEKKDKELIKKDVEIGKQQAETEKQNIQRNAFSIGFALVLLLAFFIYRGYHQKQIANKLLEEKNKLIEKQKQLVEEKNVKITNSINYAKRIQQAILPSDELIRSILPDSFIFFQPKNIVSGDFYWMHSIDDHNVLLAAVDCTGHGVPGALMSMMGYNLLEQIVKEHQIYEPSMILNELSKSVMESLKQTDELGTVKDGMDIALCKIDYQNYELEYAGAHNAIYLIRNGIINETKADRKSIGISAKATKFSNHKIKLEKGDCLYIFSDGFADQKGGSANKKFYYQPFRELLVNTSQFPMEEQRSQLERAISGWKGTKEQIDDMLVIGVRI